MFTVAAYNIEGGVGVTKGYHEYIRHGWKHFLPNTSKRIHDIADFFQERNVDIAIISEIDDMSIRTKWKSQAEIISKKSELHYYKFFPTFIFKPFFYGGNAILSRYPIIAAETIKLPGGRWSRYINKATILIDGQEVEIFVTHLSLGKKNRTKQIREIVKILSTVTLPAIIGGDFNTLTAKEMEPFEKTDFTWDSDSPTYPSWKPKTKMDYLLSNKKVLTLQDGTDLNAIFSDHLPIIGTYEILPA